ncbi:hypothetical protein PTTG_00686 [Puccinia triticina 1-1 BBBD Race 1]|uniref:Meiotic nuclear division protein 1 n=2 Tax=Puccinia triticina TaxID=208348 RepID=A0A180G6S9_PUCT1|nr:uncharacterized protein PtA15_3A97 [Puccinia triticina]OAV88189.1 hypothetical protein PTTG_00686 [Puccinia triticina 1-1 BBBD Race 1]WAQ82733.1 hypothetical protein PtA15_3A97 [Puccinia triticina]WAR53572.1 hypothetical protein PtB15_3B80 [Puccinia triticina]
MSKKGLSPEEKQARTLEFFHENVGHCNIPALERNMHDYRHRGRLAADVLAPDHQYNPAKRIASLSSKTLSRSHIFVILNSSFRRPKASSVEQTVKSLVDDGLVHVEKVGTVNLFWSFSSEASLATSRALAGLKAERDRLEEERRVLQSALEKAAADRAANEERENNLREIKVLRQDISDMRAKLKVLSNNDPQVFEEKMRVCQLYKSGAEVWTENLSMMMSYCRNEYQIDRAKFCAQFDLAEDFEEAPEKIEAVEDTKD